MSHSANDPNHPHPPSHPPSHPHNLTDAPGPIINPHVPHHISEFGEVDNLRHIDHHSDNDDLPAPPLQRHDKIAVKERMSRLRHRLFHERHLHQYFCGETLYRTEGNRSIGADELFLDLVIVGGIAALGHELRETFSGWLDVEKFLLLFGAIFNSWRAVVFLWNLWGVQSDIIDKVSIYLVFFSLTGIALGAHGAFSPGPRPWVAICSFAASAIPIIIGGFWSAREPLLQKSGLRIELSVINAIGSVICVLPYFIAAFITNETAVRVLYWVALGLSINNIYVGFIISRLINGKRQSKSRIAISIELLVEKYETLTMIVLGESVLGILFEAALLVTADGVRLGAVYGVAAAATAMLYSLQTLYHNVDSAILKGGKHAIRHNRWAGIVWNLLHFPYQAALVLFATGVGISMRDIGFPPKDGNYKMDGSRAVEMSTEGVRLVLGRIVRAGTSDGAKTTGAKFGTKQRWLFAVGWGASIILSAVIGALHLGGPRAMTESYRLSVRCIVAVGLAIGMPFANVSADVFVTIFTVVLVVMACTEYVLVQMDRMGFFRSENSTQSSSLDDVVPAALNEDMDEIEKQGGDDDGDQAAKTLRRRLMKGHVKQLVPVTEEEDIEKNEGATNAL